MFRPDPRSAWKALPLVAALVGSVVLVVPPTLATPSVVSTAPIVAGSLTISPSARIAGESATLRGSLPPQHARTVSLQRLVGTTWTTLSTKPSSSTGTFSFTAKAPTRTSRYRVLAPRATLGGISRPAVVTPTRTLTVQAQTAGLTAPSSLVTGATGTVKATFGPVRSGRPVSLQRLSGTSWVSEQSGAENTSGASSFSVSRPTAGSVTYRAVAAAWHGAAAKATPSRTVSVTAPGDTTAPGPVSGLAVTDRQTYQVTLSWTNPADPDLAGVRIRRALGATPPSTPTSGVLVFDDPKPAAEFTDDSLDPSTQYSFALFAYDSHGNYSVARTVTVTTTDDSPPSTVGDLVVSDTRSTQVSLSWTNPVEPDFAGVRVRRAVGDVPPATPTSGTAVADQLAPATTLTDTGLTPQTQYSYALFAYDTSGNFAGPANVSVTTTDATPPGPVTGLTSTGTTVSTASFTWTNPADSDFAGVEVRRAVGPTPPASPTAGTSAGTVDKPAASYTDTGLSPNTQYSYAFFAFDNAHNYATSATAQATTGTLGSADWLQARADPEQRSWSPGESKLNTANAAAVAQEWDEAPGTSLVSGTQAWVYGTDDFGDGQVRVFDLATAAQLDQFAAPGCGGGAFALTPTLALVVCGYGVRAYARSAGHALVWDTSVTDGSQTFNSIRVTGSVMVAQGPDRVDVYQLSDGNRIWQQLLPSGATGVNDVAISGTTVLVAYNDRLRALSIVNGSQLWSTPVSGPTRVVTSGSWAYVGDGTSVRQIAVSTGSAGWTVAPEHGAYEILGADADTVYIWSAVFDFSSPDPSILRALRTSDGSQRWQYDLQATRVRDIAITADLLWVVTSQIFTQGRESELTAVSLGDGAEQRRVVFADNMYGPSLAVGDGKVLFNQGGSAGEPVPARLRVFGTGGVVPRVLTGVLGVGRTGHAYSQQLTSAGTGTITWSLAGGALPDGLTLSSGGLISGTPTAAGTSLLTLRASSSNGRSHQVTLPLMVAAAGTPSWTGSGRDGTRNGFEPGNGALEVDNAPTISARWTTQAPATAVQYAGQNVAAVGTRIYTADSDGLLKAFDATGTTANRAPLWTAHAADSNYFQGRVVHATDRVLAIDSGGFLYAVDASTGAQLWKTTAGGLGDDPVVVGSTVVARTMDGHLRAYALADGSALWNGDPSPITGHAQTSPSTDGTRVYVVAGCVLYALDPATGAEVWHDDMHGKLVNNCWAGFQDSAAPIVAGGKVYASEVGSKMIASAATGDVIGTWVVGDWMYCQGVLVGGLWVYWSNDQIIAVDTTRGRVAWRKSWIVGESQTLPNFTASGDLVLVTSLSGIIGIDRRTGDTVFDGGSLDLPAVTATVGGDRIFLPTKAGIKAYGPL